MQTPQQTSGERGQAIIMLAMTLAVMLGMLALSIDIGQGYTIKRQQQNAADAGALAGASIVSEYGSNGNNADVLNAVHTVVAGNGATNPVVQYVDSTGAPVATVGSSGTIPGNAAGVSVESATSYPRIFGGVLGSGAIKVSAGGIVVAQRAAEPATYRGNLIPLGIPLLDYQQDTSYNLWGPQYAHNYQAIPNSWKGVMDFSSGDTSGPGYAPDPSCDSDSRDCHQTWSANGYGGTLGVGDTMMPDNGDKAGWVDNGIITNCGLQGTTDSGGAFGVFVIPIFTDTNPPSSSVLIAGFAAFKTYCADIGPNNLSGVPVPLPGSFSLSGTPAPSGLGGPVAFTYVTGAFPTPVATSTPLPPVTPVPSATPTPLVTSTPTATPAPSATTTSTPAPSATATATSIATATPAGTATATATAGGPTTTPTAVPTATATALPTATPTSVATPTNTATPTQTPLPTATATATASPTATSTPCTHLSISGPGFSEAGHSGKFTVTWGTNVSATTTLRWGTTSGSYPNTATVSPSGAATSFTAQINAGSSVSYEITVTVGGTCGSTVTASGMFYGS